MERTSGKNDLLLFALSQMEEKAGSMLKDAFQNCNQGKWNKVRPILETLSDHHDKFTQLVQQLKNETTDADDAVEDKKADPPKPVPLVEGICSVCQLPWKERGRHKLLALRCGHNFGACCIRQLRDCPVCNKRARRVRPDKSKASIGSSKA